MGIADAPEAVRRTWSVHVRMHQDRPLLACAQCGPLPQAEEFPVVRNSVLTHLAEHARRERLAFHLRICRCGEAGCRWHRRHRGCAGPVGLTLARTAGGRAWRLADTCLACAAATEHAATVPESDDEEPCRSMRHDGDGPSAHRLEEGYLWWDASAEGEYTG